MEHGRKYEPVTLEEYEKYVCKKGKVVKVIKSGPLVSSNFRLLTECKVVDLHNFGSGEVTCFFSSVSPLDACEIPGYFLENKDGKPTLRKRHV